MQTLRQPRAATRQQALVPLRALVHPSKAQRVGAATKKTVQQWLGETSRSTTDWLIETPGTLYSSPSRKAKKQVNYAESDNDEDEDEVFKPLSGNSRASKRRRISVKDDSDDEYGFDAATQAAMEDNDGMSV